MYRKEESVLPCGPSTFLFKIVLGQRAISILFCFAEKNALRTSRVSMAILATATSREKIRKIFCFLRFSVEQNRFPSLKCNFFDFFLGLMRVFKEIVKKFYGFSAECDDFLRFFIFSRGSLLVCLVFSVLKFCFFCARGVTSLGEFGIA